MHKKADTISIALLVFLVLLILGISLFYFITQKVEVKKSFYYPMLLDQVYEREKLLDSYINELIETSAENVKTKQEFIDNINNNLKNGKIPVNLFVKDKQDRVYFPEYSQIISQIKEENIEIIYEGEKLKEIRLTLQILLNDRFNGKLYPYHYGIDFIFLGTDPKGSLNFVYTYKKTFTVTIT